MSRIRGANTGPEIIFRKVLWANGLRYMLRYHLPGKPDLVFVSARLAVFVDGCFWHACPLHATKPKANSAFWRKKLRGNVKRDRVVNSLLQQSGWRVLRFWEHEIEADLRPAVRRVLATVRRKKSWSSVRSKPISHCSSKSRETSRSETF